MSGKKRDSLPDLRGELDGIDRALLELAQRRLKIVHRIFEAKANEGISLFDREREKEVFERARKTAAELGLQPSLAEELLQVLVYASHGLQQRLGREREQKLQTKFLIVGGRGRMGAKFCEWFREQGFPVEVLEKNEPIEKSAIEAFDVVMLAVPMDCVVETARAIGPFIRRDALLCDINSLKAEVCEAMAASCRGEVLGLHPMFGPTVSNPRRQKVIACSVRAGERTTWLLSLFSRLGAEIVESTPERHDRLMAVIQVLTHFSTVATARALARSGLTLDETLPFMSPIYRVELAFVARLFAQDPDLYAGIEMDNTSGPEMRRAFVEAAEELRHICDECDAEAFRDAFDAVQLYFSSFSEEGMKLSDLIIDAVVRQP